MKRSVKIAFCGLTTALSVVLLLLGGITYIFAYTMPMLAGLFMIMLKKSLDTSSAVITYVATSILAMMLVIEKECALMYVFFFGYYPLLQLYINKIKSKVLSWTIKVLLFNATIAMCQALLFYIFGVPILEEGEGIYLVFLFVALMNFLLVIYDLALGRIRILYELKIEKLLKKYLKY